jgi:hypothetical protein
MKLLLFKSRGLLSWGCLIIFVLLGSSTYAQKSQGLKLIEEDLDKMGLNFYTPVENTFKFSKLRLSEFYEYDSRIRAKSGEMEILIALHPDGEEMSTSRHPHIEFQRLLGNLTPNDDEQQVLVVGWREQKLVDRNADWGAEAYFRPRKAITSFPNAKLIAFFKEGHGMVVMLYCFDKPDSVPKLLDFKESLE